VRLLVDTAVLIFSMISPERISKRASVALRNPGNVLELSAISVAEIAIKASVGKLAFSDAILQEALQELGFRVLPFTAQHALKLFQIPLHHRDPFDRQMIAQALCEDIPVVTLDKEFHLYRGLKIVW